MAMSNRGGGREGLPDPDFQGSGSWLTHRTGLHYTAVRHRILAMFPRAFRRIPILICCAAACLVGADRKVDPTFLRRHLPAVEARPSDVTTPTCRYKPIFGEGDPDIRIVRGVARYGEMTVDPGGASATVNYPAEEQVYFILEGEGVLRYGEEEVPVRKEDFMYLPPGVPHGISASSNSRCRLIVMGFRIPAGATVSRPPRVLLANAADVKKEVVGGHPPSTLYQLLMGDVDSKRDKLAAARVLTSLFIMEFDADGTNFAHHHDREEEIYLVLNGHGDMVAGGGMDGIEGRHPAKAGDAYFFRLNCTVGFYAGNKPGEPKSRILAVRSLFPRGR
jgi:mannose-6-phosphate isomerase-like protein (cupin superfamily)